MSQLITTSPPPPPPSHPPSPSTTSQHEKETGRDNATETQNERTEPKRGKGETPIRASRKASLPQRPSAGLRPATSTTGVSGDTGDTGVDGGGSGSSRTHVRFLEVLDGDGEGGKGEVVMGGMDTFEGGDGGEEMDESLDDDNEGVDGEGVDERTIPSS
ncbi:hypothetical protein HYFRA_00008300 [Hymenoscyphus fraxineus]|uniref:Uncharacterized protein n=1 Tax=Hymenoscyphus fraxineus TaxID=746836 RepID=A0A9N9KR58_9HELO|nr:hypothetical protein HYFRA_00008300 [Hymenoscyphus fraxineus]